MSFRAMSSVASVSGVGATTSANITLSGPWRVSLDSVGLPHRDFKGLKAFGATDFWRTLRTHGSVGRSRRNNVRLSIHPVNRGTWCSLEGERNDSVSKPFLVMSFPAWNQNNIVTLLGCSILAMGLTFSMCRPVLAGSVLSSSATSTSKSHADRGPSEHLVEGRSKNALQFNGRDKESRAAPSSENLEEADPDFEPPYGEGTDLSTDATEIMLRSYLERHPDDVKALQALLFFRMNKGEVSAAVDILHKLVDLEPKNIEWKFMRAQTLDFAGDLDSSRKGFDEILQIEPFSARAYQGLAVVMQKNGEHSLVIEMLEGAIKNATEAKKLEEARNLKLLLGQMHTLQGNLKAALELYSVLLKDDPNDFRPYLCKGLIYSILGMSKEADQFFRRYRALCPQDFPNRGYLDELMLQAKTESRKLKDRKEKELDDKAKGVKPVKQMRQPGVDKEDPKAAG